MACTCLTNCLGITFALSGMRTSCEACDIRLFNGKLNSEIRDDSGRRCGGAALMIGSDTSSCIILIDGASGPLLALAPSEGSLISIV